MQQIVAQNRMLAGGFVIEDRSVTLADLTCPLLCFVGDADEIARPAVVRAVRRAAPRADVYESSLHAGHFGLVVGSTASHTTWPTVAQWMHWREGTAQQPESVHLLPDDVGQDQDDGPASVVDEVVAGVGLAANLSVLTARAAAQATRRSARAIRGLAEEAVEQIPRLNRLERVARVLAHLPRPAARRASGQPP